MSGPEAGAGLQRIDPDAPIFVISVAANLAGMHPQTLRTYDRLGLVKPRRARGRGRRYSPRDVARLRMIQKLSQEDGVNLEGIRRILAMQREMEALQETIADLREQLTTERERSATGRARLFTAGEDGVRITGRRQQWRPTRVDPPELPG